MKTKQLHLVPLIFCVIVVLACKQAYLPPQSATNPNYLVVEGIINTGNDSTIITLSRTVALTSTSTTSPEKGATVAVESDAGSTYPLKEIVAGTYASIPLNLDQTRMYRLRLTTSAGKVYLSDFVPSKVSPPIDSISYTTTSNNLVLYANTHDPAGNSRYYRWDYVETWQIASEFYSTWKYSAKHDSIIPRDPYSVADQIHYCWLTVPSSTVTIASTVKLSQDVVSQNQLVNIPSTDEKVAIEYSLLLKQYVLTPDAFNFWQALRNNTQTTGSIFDAQPSQLFGNIHAVANSSEVVIGYMSAGTVTQLRIVLQKSQLPSNWLYNDTVDYGCATNDYYYASFAQPGPTLTVESYLLPTNTIYTPTVALGGATSATPPGQIQGFEAAVTKCVDCTVRGSNIKPSYWK